MSQGVFITPELDDVEREVLHVIDELRSDVRYRMTQPRRWYGTLRRMAFARAVQGSNSIEGYDASLDDVAAAVDGEPTLDATLETQLALMGYRDAMTYVLQVAQDERAKIDETLVKALHFMMLKHDLSKSPGQWRLGYIEVRNDDTGKTVYVGPDADLVPDLMAAVLGRIEKDKSVPSIVRAAMAHLNLTMVHPFRDGNGRMGRCLQTLILTCDNILEPAFSSVEEYLGRNTQAYYDILAEVGQGSWHPENDARPWLHFMLTAHYRQARTHLRRTLEIEQIYARSAELAHAHGLADRCAAGLAEVAFGFRLRRNTYLAAVRASEGEEISDLTATRDLQALVKAGLLDPRGATRGRYYVGAKPIMAVREEVRAARPTDDELDPFVAARRGRQLTLDGA